MNDYLLHFSNHHLVILAVILLIISFIGLIVNIPTGEVPVWPLWLIIFAIILWPRNIHTNDEL